jgi:hypothetical protein
MAGADDARDERGQFRGRIPPEAALSVFESRADRARPVTAGDVADALDCSRRTAHNKLGELVDRGDLKTRKVGARSRVWWVPIPADEEASRAGPAESSERPTGPPGEPVAGGDDRREGPPDGRSDPDGSTGTPGEPAEPEGANATDRPDAVSTAVAEANLPGAGDTLEARREALLAAFDYLQQNPGAQRADFLRDVYPDYPADFESAAGWWNAIQPALGGLPGVDPPEERGHIWHFLGG